MPLRFLMAFIAVLSAALPVYAQPDSPSLRTEVISVVPPKGWVSSLWRGGTLELAEFTPPGETGNGYVDLLGYSVFPKGIGATAMTQAALPARERKERTKLCRQVLLRSVQHLDGWYASQGICIGRKGAPDPNQIVVNFAVERVGEQAVFRVWREWRGTQAELTAMLLLRTGKVLSPISSQGTPYRVNELAVDEALAALAPMFEADLNSSAICNMRTAGNCRAFRGDLPKEATTRLRGRIIAGFYGRGLSLIPREEFRRRLGVTGLDNELHRVFVILEPKDLDWSDKAAVDNLLLLVGTGIVTDGGSLVASDPDENMSAEQRARVRVEIVMAGRRLWRVGQTPDIITIFVPGD